jgi:hypothetical protein
VVAFAFSFIGGTSGSDPRVVGSPLLWSMLSFSTLFVYWGAAEKERGLRNGGPLSLLPVSGSRVYLGKLMAALVQCALVALAGLAVFLATFPAGAAPLGPLLLVIALGLLGHSALGVGLALALSRSGTRHAVAVVATVPLVLFSIVLPAVTATSRILAGGEWMGADVLALGGFSAIYIIAGAMLAEHFG